MKKILFVLLILVGLMMTACNDGKCDTNLDCKDYEACIDGTCENTDCSDNCPYTTGNPCSKYICSAQTRNLCKEVADYGENLGCRGPVSDKECKKYYCDNMACLEQDDSECIRAKEYEARQIPCSDGTKTGSCSKVNPGKYCDEGKLIGGFEEDCLEDIKEDNKKEAPQLMPDPCGDLPHGECSVKQEGMRCEDGNLVLDETCLPEITECNDGTMIGDCSEESQGYLCSGDGTLVEEESCNIIEGCGDTPDGDCSPDGRWCVHGQLIADEACANACEDGTPNWGCSFNTLGYICEDGVLVEEPTCDPDYVYMPVACEDGTQDGFCNSAGTQWCDHGVLVDLQEGESC